MIPTIIKMQKRGDDDLMTGVACFQRKIPKNTRETMIKIIDKTRTATTTGSE